jgi:hypothetical protein
MLRLVLVALIVGLLGSYVIVYRERRRLERVARIRAAFLAVHAELPGPSALKAVALRNAGVRFRVPEAWSEEYPDGENARFSDRGGSRRVLHVTGTTLPITSVPLADVLRARAQGPSTVETLPSGDVLVKSLSRARDGEREAVGFTWMLGRALSPERARLACFTLSVPLATAHDVLTRNELVRLEHEVRTAELGPA